MPTATPSPWNRRSEKPVAASSAWPNVWPRLSSARSPVSRSSRETTPALARQEVAIACSRAEPPRRQRVEHGGVGDHKHRLVEGAEQVLALRRVDAGLATDGGIDLRQQ